MKEKNQSRYFVHNGDVQAIESILPKDAKKINHTPLAYGEKSGHIHIATGDVQLFEYNNVVYVTVSNEGAMIQHVHQSLFNGDYSTLKNIIKAEHNATVLLPNKTYKIGIQKRYNPFHTTWGKVID
jgi:hypothetical protein